MPAPQTLSCVLQNCLDVPALGSSLGAVPELTTPGAYKEQGRDPSAGDSHTRGSGLVGTGWVGSLCFMTAVLEFRIVQLRTLTLHTHPDLCSMPRSTPSSWLCHALYLWQAPAFPGNLENGKLNVRHTI